MTGRPGEGWKIFAEGDEADNVPLWKMLAQLRSDNLDEGLNINAAIINEAKPSPVRYHNLAFAVSFGFGFLSIICLIGLLLSGHSKATDLFFYLTLAALAATAAPHLWRQLYQYGLKIPDAPLQLHHASDRLFEVVLGHLQKVDGPQAYFVSRFGKKRIPLKRRQFFGRLRYFLFSEHDADRRLVMRFRSGQALPSDIFIHRDDLDRMVLLIKPKRKGGPGTNAKYPYEDAIVGLIGDPRLAELDLRDEEAALRSLVSWIVDWFKVNADETGDIPRSDYDRVQACARKIYDRLKDLSPPMVR